MLSALAVLLLFGSMFFSLIPSRGAHAVGVGPVPWQVNTAGVVAGLLAGWLFHPRKAAQPGLRFRAAAR